MTSHPEPGGKVSPRTNDVPDVSVVIANYNGARALPLTLPSLLVQQGVLCREIILVDNLSTDDSLEVVRSSFPTVKLVSSGANNGPNQARNMGLRLATAPFVLIMDNDLVLAPDYLARLAQLLVMNPQAGAASGKIRHYSNPEDIQYNGIDIHYVGEVRMNRPEARGCRIFSCISAGAMMVRKSWVEAVGGFDEDYVFGWEDGDLAFRLSLAGHPCWVDSDAQAFHQSLKRGFKWVRLQTRNRWWFMRKNYDRRTFYLSLPAILFFQCLGGIYMALNGQGGEFVRGTWEGWGNGSTLRRKHASVQRLRCVSDREILCGDRLSLPAGLDQTIYGQTLGWLVSKGFWLYWLVIRLFIKR